MISALWSQVVYSKQPTLGLTQELIGSDLAWMADLAWIGRGVYSTRPHSEDPVWPLSVTPGAHHTCLEAGITPSVFRSAFMQWPLFQLVSSSRHFLLTH